MRDGEEQESAPHSKQILHVELEGGRAEAYDILRRKNKMSQKALDEKTIK